MREPTLIVDYDPRWPEMFEQEKALLTRTVGGVLINPLAMNLLLVTLRAGRPE